MGKQMNKQLRFMRLLWGLGAFLLVAMPVQAFAHDNVGDDELAVANWMLIAAFVAIVIGAFMGLWAYRTGQFSNVEESKYTMLDTAEDFDSIMDESDAREAEKLAAEVRGSPAKPGIKAASANASATASAGKPTRL